MVLRSQILLVDPWYFQRWGGPVVWVRERPSSAWEIPSWPFGMSTLDAAQFGVFVVFGSLILALLVALLVVAISGDR